LFIVLKTFVLVLTVFANRA